jgi:hypothetical protein
MLCCAAAASEFSTARETPAPPAGPFEAVHLIRVKPDSPDAQKRMLAALAAMNEAIVKAGCDSCIYHLWKANLPTPFLTARRPLLRYTKVAAGLRS